MPYSSQESAGIAYRLNNPTIITDFIPSLEVPHILEGQGVPPSSASAQLVAMAQEVLGEAEALLSPAALFTILPVLEIAHHQVFLEHELTFTGALVARAMAGATAAAVVVCTVGPGIDERISALFAADDPLRALAMEGAGVAAIKGLVAMVGNRICDEAAARGLSVGMRASPGQEGWSIQEQRQIFSLISPEKIGVRLTSSFLMLPRKSVSFVLGLGPEMRADAVSCDFCSKRESCRWSARMPGRRVNQVDS